MNIQSMHYDFDLKIDKVNSYSRESFNQAEKDWLLQEAIWVWSKNKYGLNNTYQTGFEGSQKRIQDLIGLHVKYPEQPEVPAISLGQGIYEIKLSELSHEYWLLTNLNVKIEKGDCIKGAKEVVLIQHDDLQEALRDPHTRPSFKEGVVIYNFGRSVSTPNSTGLNVNKGSIYIYTDQTFSVVSASPEYIKYPNRVWIGTYDLTSDLQDKNPSNTYIYQAGVDSPVSCELDAQGHPEIVDLAVAIASGIIENPNFMQMKQMKSNTNE